MEGVGQDTLACVVGRRLVSMMGFDLWPGPSIRSRSGSGAYRWVNGGGRGPHEEVVGVNGANRTVGRWVGAAITALGLFGAACQDVGVGGTPEPVTPGEVAPLLALSPRTAALGEQLTATVSGVSTRFEPGVTVSLGQGVVVGTVEVVSAGELRLPLSVAAEALPGYRTLTVTRPDGSLALEEALLLQSGRFSVDPVRADRGQSLVVRFDVVGVPMTAGYTWADFGAGISTDTFTVLDDGSGLATVSIASDAAPGPRDVSLQNGPSRVLLRDGFTVDRGLVSIRFEPGRVSQGQERVDYTITGVGTHFEAGRTTVVFDTGLLLDPEDASAMVVMSPTLITGHLNVCRGAEAGRHEVKVTTLSADGWLETVTAEEGLQVDGVAPSVEEGYGSFSLALSRSVERGELIEGVSAFASFQIATGACGTPNGTGCPSEAAPPNMPSFYPPPGCVPTNNTVLFPPPPSLDAGPSVWFEGPGGVPSIRLDREIDSDGTWYYTPSEEIPLEAFVPNTRYDVRVPGASGEGGLPAFTLEGVIVTPPALFSMVSPDLAWGPTLNPFDSVLVEWMDDAGEATAHTYPLATLSFRMSTTSVADGTSTRLDVRQIIPDDGELLIPADAVSFLAPGVGRMTLSASRIGDVYQLPGSRYASYAASSVIWGGVFELRE